MTDESVQNFRRAAIGDALLGVLDLTSGDVHLALVTPRDGSAIPADRHSVIAGVRRAPLPGAGGHSALAGWAGIAGAAQLAPGVASGAAYGFSIAKTAVDDYAIGTFKSGLNVQYPVATHPRPPIPPGMPPFEAARTVPAAIIPTIEAALNAALRGTGGGT